MSGTRPAYFATGAAVAALAGVFGPWLAGSPGLPGPAAQALLAALAVVTAALALRGTPTATAVQVATALGGATVSVVIATGPGEAASWGYFASLWGFLLAGLHATGRVTVLEAATAAGARVTRVLPPAVVPWILLLVWQGLVTGYAVPKGIFPGVVDVARALAASLPVLLEDAYVTFVKEVAFGFALGLAAGFLSGVAIAYSRFLQRGFLPLAAAFGAVPIVGIAPVLGRAFGVDWESKAAVVVVVTFFPVVLNTVEGLVNVDRLELELLRAYAAKPREIFFKLRLPNALPFIFNALKLAVVISVISVIVAEFLIPGPPQGLGQRISLSARRGAFDLVFAAIAVSSLISILVYGALAALERTLTGWHASFRDPDA